MRRLHNHVKQVYTDYLDQEIKLGDQVAFITRRGERSLTSGIVLDLHPKRIEVKNNAYPRGRLVYPEDVIVIMREYGTEPLKPLDNCP